MAGGGGEMVGVARDAKKMPGIAGVAVGHLSGCIF